MAGDYPADRQKESVMSKVLRRMVIAVVIVFVLLGGALAWLNWQVHREKVTPLATVNEGGTAGRALAVLSPGMSAFPGDVMTAFMNGLAEKDWRVDHTTASGQATTAFGDYDLIVLVSPIYGSQVAPPLQAYVERAGDFGGKRVVAVITAGGDPDESVGNTEDLVTAHNGTLQAIYGHAVYQPNDPAGHYEGSNTERAIAMAHDAATDLARELQ